MPLLTLVGEALPKTPWGRRRCRYGGRQISFRTAGALRSG